MCILLQLKGDPFLPLRKYWDISQIQVMRIQRLIEHTPSPQGSYRPERDSYMCTHMENSYVYTYIVFIAVELSVAVPKYGNTERRFREDFERERS